MALNSDWPNEFSLIASAGYYVALRVGFAFPVDERNEFPSDWVEYYTRNGLMLRDPVVKWVYENTGSARWSDIVATDTHGIFAKARTYGMNFGAVICLSSGTPNQQRSYGTFARADREFSYEEISLLNIHLKQLHDASFPPENLTTAELEALRMVKDGHRLKEIAFEFSVSEGAIKQRLAGAKKKLKARTNAHAASMAVEFKLI